MQSSWTKPDPTLVERFYAALPDHPAAERRKMFGYPACFVNGNYFAGLHEQRVVIKLPGDSCNVAPELADAPSFDPRGTGRGMKDWYVIPAEIAADDQRLADLLAVTIVEVAKLPPKHVRQRRSQVPA